MYGGILRLDITRSYKKCLTQKLKYGCPEEMADWDYELLTPRNLQITYENFILEVTTNIDIPQGGVCSAKFWFKADKAAQILNSNGVSGELFSEDGNGLIGGTDIETMASDKLESAETHPNGKRNWFSFLSLVK